MIRFIYADSLHHHPKLANTMFRDRATQFHARMGWDVSVDSNGWERDEYDDLNPLYVIAQAADGTHAGSMRLLPTTGDTMVNDHFSDLLGGGSIVSPMVWECTRFCLAPGGKPSTAAALMLAGGQVLKGMNITSFVGVFDAPMLRIYGAIGSKPDVLGTVNDISVGLWQFSATAQAKISRRARVSPGQMEHWFNRDFNREETPLIAEQA